MNVMLYGGPLDGGETNIYSPDVEPNRVFAFPIFQPCVVFKWCPGPTLPPVADKTERALYQVDQNFDLRFLRIE